VSNGVPIVCNIPTTAPFATTPTAAPTPTQRAALAAETAVPWWIILVSVLGFILCCTFCFILFLCCWRRRKDKKKELRYNAPPGTSQRERIYFLKHALHRFHWYWDQD